MAVMSNGFDGRESTCYLLEPLQNQKDSGTVKKGTYYFPMKKASEASGIPAGATIGRLQVALSDITLAEGDEVDFIQPKDMPFCGFATSKDLSKSKNTVDVTCDYDQATMQISDGVVTVSGSISGQYMTEDLTDPKSAINIIKSSFDDITQITSTGTTYRDMDPTSRHILLLLRNARNAKTKEMVEAEVVTVLFSELACGAEYQNTQPFNASFVGNDSDGMGHYSSIIQFEWIPEAKPAYERPASSRTVTA